MNIERFNSLKLLLNTTARIMKLYQRFKINGRQTNMGILPDDIEQAEKIWIVNAQLEIIQNVTQSRYSKLRPRVEDGIVVVGGRTERWLEAATWNRSHFILLLKEHKPSHLIALHEHESIGHLATEATIAKIRSKFWIIGVRRVVNAITHKCVKCKRKFERRAEQRIAPLPVERIKPSPLFTNIGVDYFGPFITKGEVQKRTRGKCYRIIYSCDFSRAVHLDIVPNYSTSAFLQALRGWPQKIHSDQGTQLCGAAAQLKNAIKNLDWEEIQRYGHQRETQWNFSPADSKWYSGSTEALVKTTKRALSVTIRDHACTFSEFQVILFEVAQIVNQRPIGRKPTSIDEPPYLSPNDLLLGRSTNLIPQGPFDNDTNIKDRYKFTQAILNNFWKRWTREVFPALVVEPKWHIERRNVEVGDVVLVQDSNALRGEWRMAIVSKADPSEDKMVRKVEVTYKNGQTPTTVSRAVQKLIVLVPNENKAN